MSVPSVRRLLLALSAASQVDNPETKALHVATARALYGATREAVARAGESLERMELELARRQPSQASLPGVDGERS